jgi:hypothetical protein
MCPTKPLRRLSFGQRNVARFPRQRRAKVRLEILSVTRDPFHSVLVKDCVVAHLALFRTPPFIFFFYIFIGGGIHQLGGCWQLGGFHLFQPVDYIAARRVHSVNITLPSLDESGCGTDELLDEAVPRESLNGLLGRRSAYSTSPCQLVEADPAAIRVPTIRKPVEPNVDLSLTLG